MHPDHLNIDINREVEKLEDAYVDAFVDRVDAKSLATVWDRIKSLRQEIEGRRNGDNARCPSG
jgi:hypothetical protein